VIEGAAEPGNNNRGHQQRHDEIKILVEKTAERGGWGDGTQNRALIDSSHLRPHDCVDAELACALENLERRNT
jgi:hypothetical protein